jgi:hypothetical protein
MESTNYQKDFVERTKKLMENYYKCIEKEDELEVTFLINCLLGLVVVIAERGVTAAKGLIKDKDFLRTIKICFLNKKTNNMQCVIENNETTADVEHKETLGAYQYQWFLTKMRNAIAHQHIEPINEDEKWKGVRMWNESANGIKDFEIVLTSDELKNIAIGIAEDYLHSEDT